MATDFDPYGILEVEASARQDQIDEAYRRQWAAYPRDPAPDARLREIQAAYRVLSDPAERRSYDERRATAATTAAAVAIAEALAIPPELAPPTPGNGAPWGLGDIVRAVLVVVGVVIAASIPIFIAAAAIAGGSDNINNSPTALTVVLLASVVFQATALGAAFYFGPRKYKVKAEALGWRKPDRGWPWLPFVLVTGALLIVFAYSIILSIAGVHPDTNLPDAVYNHAVPLAIILALTVLIAPVIEETFFRGFVFGGLMRRWGPAWGAIGSGVLFGAAHLANSGYLYVVPPIVGIGILFAFSYRYSRSLYPSMAAHLMFNLIQMIGVLVSR